MRKRKAFWIFTAPPTAAKAFPLPRFAKISAAHSVCLITFLALYIILDGAGTRPAWFCLAKGGVSFICNFVLAIIVTNILTPDDRK